MVLRWQEAQQNFVLSYAVPTQRLVEVFPTPTYPAGVVIPHVAVSSLYAETAAVQASPQPSLLLAEDAGGTVLLALANMDGGLLGEGQGAVEVSVESTAVVLVGLAAGIAVSDMTRSIAAAIVQHRQYPALVAALSTRMAADTHFLDRLYDEPEAIRRIREMAVDTISAAQTQAEGASFASGSGPHYTQGQTQPGTTHNPHPSTSPGIPPQEHDEGAECEPGEVITDTPSRQARIDLAWDLVHTFINSTAARTFWRQRAHTFRKYRHYAACMQEQEREWLADYRGPLVPTERHFTDQGPFNQLKGTIDWLTHLVRWEKECAVRRLPRVLWDPLDYIEYLNQDVATSNPCPLVNQEQHCPGVIEPHWVRVGIEGWQQASAEYKKLLKEVEQGEMQCEEEEDEEEEPNPEEEDEEEELNPEEEDEEEELNPEEEDEEEEPNPEEEDEEEEPNPEEEDEELNGEERVVPGRERYCSIYVTNSMTPHDSYQFCARSWIFPDGRFVNDETSYFGTCQEYIQLEALRGARNTEHLKLELRGEYDTCEECSLSLPTNTGTCQ